ncbi:MAG: PIG-L deacetylase family protein [Caulobacterales bacterium]
MTDTDSHPLLAAIADPARAPIEAADVAIVAAHPDDETLAFGVVMRRLEGAKIVMATDGAPRNLPTARELGFAGHEAYAAARRAELSKALALAGKTEADIVRLDFADQEAADNVAVLARRLGEVFAEHGTRTVLTHAYEGGHPDHDAVAAAVAHAARGLGVTVIEAPISRLRDGRYAVQSFVPLGGPEPLVTLLTPEEAELKLAMLACHATQASLLHGYVPRRELFRIAPAYDFGQPPNHGAVMHEASFDGVWQWPDWSRKVTTALAEA